MNTKLKAPGAANAEGSLKQSLFDTGDGRIIARRTAPAKFSTTIASLIICDRCRRRGSRLAGHVPAPGAAQIRLCRGCWLAAIATETHDRLVASWRSLFRSICSRVACGLGGAVTAIAATTARIAIARCFANFAKRRSTP